MCFFGIPKMNSDPKNQICVVFTWLVSLVISLIFIILAAFLSAGIADRAYNLTHAIPDTVTRGDDLGGGLVVITWAALSLLLSVPLVFFLFKYFRQLTSIIFGCKQ